MKNKENCEIVKDLLPNYVDNLTSEKTRKFVEEHIKECDECNEIYKNMTKGFEKEKENLKKEVKYTKKYNKKIKILMIIIILIVLALFLLTFVRNAIIIKSLISKAEEYDNCNNCHTTLTSYSKENLMIFETYYKNGKSYTKILNCIPELIESEDVSYTKDEIYYDGKTEKWYRNNELMSSEDKENSENFIFLPKDFAQVKMYDYNLLTFIKSCATLQISSEKFDGAECYRIKSYFGDEPTYIDQKTGLSKGVESGYSNKDGYKIQYSNITFEFNSVTDEDVSEDGDF